MKQSSAKAPSTFQILVFKDHFPSRSFTVSKNWLIRLGLVTVTLISLLLCSVFISIRLVGSLERANPGRVIELERELAEARAELESLRTSSTPLGSNYSAPPAADAGGTPSAVKSASVHDSTTSPILRAFSNSIHPLPPGVTSKISVTGIQTRWHRNLLRVNFNIEYTAGDSGNQQGYIFVMVRGSKTLLAYPSEAMSPKKSKDSDDGFLITPSNGEHFSISRFRGVLAEFGPVPEKSDLQTLEILLISNNNEILIHNMISLEGRL